MSHMITSRRELLVSMMTEHLSYRTKSMPFDVQKAAMKTNQSLR
ncbi:unnamed protein product [Anisakis simplex]|uniref:Transposase n=1 Tax=Anisakis simplex TaxID=6269 RepID=A0A0M3JG85_ANISI|nr:unnamed protein product [Anisakis simplex]